MSKDNNANNIPDSATPASDKKHGKGHPFLIIGGAVLLLFLLSLLPWSSITNGKIKDFNLLSDIFGSEETVQGDEVIDPALLAAQNETLVIADAPVDAVADSTPDTPPVPREIKPGQVPETQASLPDREVEDRPVRVGDDVVLEDYTTAGAGLTHFRNALAQSGSRPARVAVIGDSYIEGDIYTQDIRSQLQSRYGGHGVGYMPAHSIVQGFRTTVGHSDNGWTNHKITGSGCHYYSLPGEYHTGTSGATISYKGKKNNDRLQQWSVSRLLFIAPSAGGSITLTTDSGDHSYDVEASDQVQQILLNETTGSLKITSRVPGLVLLGTWLEDGNGVVVDNMSLRGYSGITHRNLDPALAAQMRQYVDYDLIVVEYGINALSSSQHDYKHYSDIMSAVIARLKLCYPNADIVLMGIGDRGQKVNGAVHSMSTAPNMVDAQRRAARNGAVVFWDTREAMGGNDAVVEWRNNKFINPDYIHLNSAGGRKLAELFVTALLK